jgi:hypothetical protein
MSEIDNLNGMLAPSEQKEEDPTEEIPKQEKEKLRRLCCPYCSYPVIATVRPETFNVAAIFIECPKGCVVWDSLGMPI